MRPRRCITCLSLSCLSRLSSIKPFSQQSYAMQASGPAPITGGWSLPPAVLTEGCHTSKVMIQPGLWWSSCTTLREIAEISPHFLFLCVCCVFVFTLLHSNHTFKYWLSSCLQVMKAQQGCQCLPVPPLGRVEVLPAPSCECWSSPPSWSNLRTQRLWVDKRGDNFVSKRQKGFLLSVRRCILFIRTEFLHTSKVWETIHNVKFLRFWGFSFLWHRAGWKKKDEVIQRFTMTWNDSQQHTYK